MAQIQHKMEAFNTAAKHAPPKPGQRQTAGPHPTSLGGLLLTSNNPGPLYTYLIILIRAGKAKLQALVSSFMF